jgi:hypothetical protein
MAMARHLNYGHLNYLRERENKKVSEEEMKDFDLDLDSHVLLAQERVADLLVGTQFTCFTGT